MRLGSLGGYPVYHTLLSKQQHKHRFDIVISDRENVTIGYMKDIVSVSVDYASYTRFHNVTGLMGNFQSEVMARDGVTNLGDDMNAMAHEWQVRDNEAWLFRNDGAPQYPAKCRLPTNTDAREARRLGEGITEQRPPRLFVLI